MKRKFNAVVSSLVVVAVGFGGIRIARAIPVPDTASTCTGSGDCFKITTTNVTNAVAIKGAATGQSTAVVGVGTSGGIGVEGNSDNVGVSAIGGPFGVLATASASVAGAKAVSGSTNASPGYGIYGSVAGGSSYGVYGSATNTSSYGVYGTSTQYIGVYGSTGSASSYGVYGSSSNGIAIRGDGVSRGVHGTATATNGIGVSGLVTTNNLSAKGIYGLVSPAGDGVAVYGDNTGTSTNAFAGYFNGRLKVVGQPICSVQTTFTLSSDARLKKNVQPLTGALDKLLALRGVTFEWKNPEEHGNLSGTQRGFIAQEVEKVLPEWVGVQDDGMKNVTTRGLEAMVVESLRTLKTENDSLRDRVKALEARQFVAAAGLNGSGVLGLGLVVLAGAIVVSRRRAPRPSA